MATRDVILDELAARVFELDGLIYQQQSEEIKIVIMILVDRFINMNTDSEAFIENMTNNNTVRKAQSDVKINYLSIS